MYYILCGRYLRIVWIYVPSCSYLVTTLGLVIPTGGLGREDMVTALLGYVPLPCGHYNYELKWNGIWVHLYIECGLR